MLCTDRCPCPPEVEQFWPGKVFSETDYVSNWSECIEKVNGTKFEDFNQRRLIGTSRGDIYLSRLEQMFEDCASICDTVPDFYLSKNLTEGPPKFTCTDVFLRGYYEGSNSVTQIIYPIILFIVVTFAFLVVAFPFNLEWCRKQRDR